jgi:SAM-dependent methyltransferase
MPTLTAILEREGVRTVLDAACGTGAHLAALAALGYEVTGTDLSPEMVERARERSAGPVHVAGFDRTGEVAGEHDAVLVLGNSLPNAGSEEGMRAALAGLAAAVRPDGILLLHLLNYPKLIADGGGSPRPFYRVAADGRKVGFLKRFAMEGDLVVLTVRGEIDGEVRDVLRSDLWPVDVPWLTAALPGAGLFLEETAAGLSGEPFDPKASGDLLVIARRVA